MRFVPAKGTGVTASPLILIASWCEGDCVRIVPGRHHRMVAVEDCEFFEVSSPEINDVIRLEDRYGREGTSAG